MRRLAATILLIVLLGAIAPGAALAGKPSYTCPAASSGWMRVDGEGWWAGTVAGIEQDGLTVEEAAALFGFGSVQAFKSWVIADVLGNVDGNGNGYVCQQDLPNTPGLPGYIFNATDDNASSRANA